jgi:peptide/nickel transport system substrate-binding protein
LKAVDPEEYGQGIIGGTLAVFEYARTGEYTDADSYLLPYQAAARLLTNHAGDAALETLIAAQAIEVDPDLRETQIVDAQARLAQLLTVIPLVQSTQIVVSSADVDGVVLDASSKFRFASLTR